MIRLLALVIAFVIFLTLCSHAEDQSNFTKTNVTANYLSMIYQQQQLIYDFHGLLNQSYFALEAEDNATFTKLYKDLLHNQSSLDISFGELLGNETNWSFEKNSTKERFLGNYSDLIAQEMSIYQGYYELMSTSWCQEGFKNSDSGYLHAMLMRGFQDLLIDQNDPIKHYGELLLNMGNEVALDFRKASLAKYSNLMMSHADLLLNVKEKIQNPCTSYIGG